MTRPALELFDLCRHYREGEARLDILIGASLTLHPGETMALIAPSGAGKSTLLHIAGLLERPDSGEVLIDGRATSRMSDEARTRLRRNSIGFVYQFHHLLPEFTALENVMMPALIARVPKSKAREDAEAILVRVGLQHRLRHRVSTLSGGEQQRVAVARALVLKPEVLLADEPTGNLDPHSGSQVQELLLDLNREQGLTSVIVTHNLDLAQALTRQITLVDGKAMIV